jgi:cytidylate kinase
MPVITISRGSYSKGKEIAEKLASKLSYECVSRDILIETSEQFNIPEVKLIRALHDAPSILERFTHGKEKYVAYIKKALLEHVAKGNVVYHGLAGHFFLQGISHVMKVRIIANLEDRVREEMKRENIAEAKARQIVAKDDEERRKWGLHLYGMDTFNASLYDIVLHIDSISVDEAVDILAHVSTYPCFNTTESSQREFLDRLLAAKAEALLVEKFPAIKVSAKEGVVHVHFHNSHSDSGKINLQVCDLLKDVDGVKGVWTNLLRDHRFE